jgi:hypothetical protein
VTTTLLAQDRHSRLGDVHDTVEVGLDLRPERVDRRVLERAQVAIPGVVDDDIDATERLLGLSNHARSRVVVERDLDERATQTARTSLHEPHLGHRDSSY